MTTDRPAPRAATGVHTERRTRPPGSPEVRWDAQPASARRRGLRVVRRLAATVGALLGLVLLAGLAQPAAAQVNVTLSTTTPTIVEGQTATFRVTASSAPTTDLSVRVQVYEPASVRRGDSAVGYVSYSNQGDRTVTIASGSTTATFTVQTRATTATERDGTIHALVLGGTGYWAGASGSAKVTVTDGSDTPAPVSYTIRADASAITEGGTASFRVLRSRAQENLSESVTVNITQEGSFARSGDLGSRTVTFAHGKSSAHVRVRTDRAAPFQEPGKITATITAVSSGDSGEGQKASVTVNERLAQVWFRGFGRIASDPPPPGMCRDDLGRTITCKHLSDNPAYHTPATNNLRVQESVAGTIEVDLQAWSGESRDATVRWQVSGTATLGDDYSIAGLSGTSGTTRLDGRGSGVIRVRIIDDSIADNGETVILTLQEHASYAMHPTRNTVTITILNHDPDDPDAVEDKAAPQTQAPIAQCASSLPADAVGVAELEGWRDDPAHSGNQDHADRWNRALKALDPSKGAGTAMTAAQAKTWADKGWSRWVRTHATLEAIETCLAGTPATPRPTPEISIAAGAGVTEGAAATFTLTASPPPPAPLAVAVTIADAAGSDFVASSDEGARQVTIPVSGSVELSVATASDATDEPDGSVTATLAAGTGYTVAASANTASVAVADDDDPAPSAQAPIAQCASELPSNAVSVAEVEGWRDDPQHSGNQDHVDRWSRALAALDPAKGSGTPMTAAQAKVFADRGWGRWVRTHATLEAIETCLAAATPTTPTTPQAPEVSIAGGPGITEGGAATFTVTASAAPASDLAVTLTVSEAAGSDFVAAGDEGARNVTIAAGATTAAFTVATADDATDEPDGAVTVTLAAGTGYTLAASPGDAATVAVADDDAAQGQAVTLSISDARVRESATSWQDMKFTLTLSAPLTRILVVELHTRDVTATAGEDYHAQDPGYGIVHAGRTTGIAKVTVYNDFHDEGEETFAFDITGVRHPDVVIADGTGVGTIVNTDPLPAAWLARFGRTVAEAALDGISGRLAAERTPGMRGSLAGQAIGLDPWASETAAADDTAATTAASGEALRAMAEVARGLDGAGGAAAGTGWSSDTLGSGLSGNAPTSSSRTMTARELLLGSSFSLTGQSDASGGSMALWGRAAHGTFDGKDWGDGAEVGLDGEVTTAMLGADYARGRWLVGLALARSTGEGAWRDENPAPPPLASAPSVADGTVESSLTAAIPYASLQASERLGLWGAFGYGTGEVTLKPDEGRTMKADTEWTMAAAGVRGDLLAPPADGTGGPSLAIVSDALWAGTSSDKATGLAVSDSGVTRLRLGLEGSWRVALEGGGSLTPKLEAGARHDGGDAETGFGVELGGGIAWSDPNIGLILDLSGRTLLAHEDGDLEDRGISASLAFDPNPATERGLSLSLRQEMGGRADGGLDALFANDPPEGRTGGDETAARWTAEAAYGLPAFGGRFTGSPHAGIGLAAGARDYTLGWRLTPAANDNAPDLSFGLKASRRESDTAQPEHALGFEVRTQW